MHDPSQTSKHPVRQEYLAVFTTVEEREAQRRLKKLSKRQGGDSNPTWLTPQPDEVFSYRLF